MPGDENNLHLQPPGAAAGMGVNNPHPAPGVQQLEEGFQTLLYKQLQTSRRPITRTEDLL